MIRVTLCFECPCGQYVEKIVEVAVACPHGGHTLTLNAHHLTIGKLWMDEQGTKWVLLKHKEPLQPGIGGGILSGLAPGVFGTPQPPRPITSTWTEHAQHPTKHPHCHLCFPQTWGVPCTELGEQCPLCKPDKPQQEADWGKPLPESMPKVPLPNKLNSELLKDQPDCECDDAARQIEAGRDLEAEQGSKGQEEPDR